MRVLIVDDSGFMRRAIRRMIESDPDLEVVGEAANGKEAVEQVKKLKPDVVTLDIQMPVMDGLAALAQIMAECPTPVLMCSSLTKEGSREALRALRLGARDFVAKDASHTSLKIDEIRDDLLAKIKAIGGSKVRRFVRAPEQVLKVSRDDSSRVKKLELRAGDFDLIAIGSSTGGPPVLEKILTSLPADLSAPVVIAQHMPVVFTKAMAERLDTQCAVTVVHGMTGMPLHPGTVYIAPGGQHVHIRAGVKGRLTLRVSDEPKEAYYKPSVDALLESAAKAVGKRCLGVVLTGMGRDGAIGAKALADAGGLVLAQDEGSCVVYGMPKAVVAAGAAKASLTPEEIAAAIGHLGSAPPAKKAGEAGRQRASA